MRDTGMMAKAAQATIHKQAALWEMEQVALFLRVAARNGWTQAIPPMRLLLAYWRLVFNAGGETLTISFAKEWAKGLDG